MSAYRVGGGSLHPGGLPTGGGGAASGIRKAGGTHPTGMLSCLTCVGQ